ncbi:MAG: SGNH/GDSL hydrolase family protein [Betaproteobacteria bacterium]
MKKSWALAGTALILWGVICPVAAQTWISTWAAPAFARVDQPAQTLSPTARAFPWSQNVPTAAAGQELVVAGASPQHFKDQTIRQIAHVSAGGSQVRIVLANSLGTLPLRIGAASVAMRGSGSSVLAGSNRSLTFGGLASPVIPAGAILVSDPVDLKVGNFSDVVIDLYLPDDTSAWKSPVTMHAASWQVNFVSTPGNHVGSTSFPVATTTAYRRGDGLASASSFFLARVEVVPDKPTGVLVALGDSITDGTQSGIDANRRWPDLLAARLASAGMSMSVVNGGIGGGRVLDDGVGPNALARFDRDVLAQPGVTHVTIMEGINDIGGGGSKPYPSVADLIAGHRQMIDRAHARGIRVIGATLTPFEGAAYWTPEGEAKRQALNNWIRTSKAYDEVLDFDAAVRDPANPNKSQAAFDSGDHLHPSPAGYEAMASSIDLAIFRSKK